MLRKTLSAAVLAATLAGAAPLSTGSAEAAYGRHAAFAAGAALGFLGGAAIASGPAYGYGYDYGYAPAYYAAPACWWKRVRVYDPYYGTVVRRVRVCR